MTPRMNFRLVTFLDVSPVLACSEVSGIEDSPGFFTPAELRCTVPLVQGRFIISMMCSL
ncbi:hypothetical protein SBA5_150086 [Candidatus Sulfotelmatomonas gaucii]|uniref:Uncharacterized protein n=1 Tax=Candidatus Sulfuritelmatomonas gaucii TaxID=2043161 RepID=A0A2N9L4X9_9BACT|nr:hypothetical protein SBA5_150086 [Candidatus Sulfotelmatomonas gaucii]